MSRLIVKNLPPEINKLDLEHIFNQNGQITEISLKKDSQGRSRNFAFIGYHNEHDADQAMKSLNNTFIKTNKIQVERCLNIPKEKRNNEGESNKRKMSQSDSRQPRKKQKRFKEDPVVRDILVEKYQTDPEFAEFLDLKSPGQAAKVRAVLNLPNKNKAEKVPSNTREPVKQQKLKRGDIINLLYHVKLRDLPRGTNKKMIEEFFDPIHCASIRTVKSVRSIAYVGFMHEDERKRALAKNKNYIKGQCIRVIEYNDNYTRKQVLRKRSSTRIYFNDLPGINTVDDVKKIFSVYGEIKSIVMPKNANNELKGFGLVSYVNGSDAGKAYKELRRTALRSKVVIGPEQNPRVSQSKLTECEDTEPIYDMRPSLSKNESRKRGEHRRERSEEYRSKNTDDSKRSRTDRYSQDTNRTSQKSRNHRDNGAKSETRVRDHPELVFRVYLRNVPQSTKVQDVERLFRAYGPSNIDLPINAENNHTGHGFISFKEKELAELAFDELKQTALKENMILYIGSANKAPPVTSKT